MFEGCLGVSVRRMKMSEQLWIVWGVFVGSVHADSSQAGAYMNHTMSSQLSPFLFLRYQNIRTSPCHLSKNERLSRINHLQPYFFISPMNGHWWLNRQQELLLGGFWLGQRFCLLLACATGRADDGPGGKKGSSRSLQHPLRFTPYKI